MTYSLQSPLPPSARAVVPIPDSSFSLRLVFAAAVSALVPGIGHFLVKRWRRGCTLLSLCILLLLVDWRLRPALHVWSFGLTVLASIALNVYSAWDVGYSSSFWQGRLSQWWLVFLLPLALAGTSVQANLGFRLAGTRPYNMIAGSMERTIPRGSNVMVDLRYYQTRTPERGDIIVFQHPHEPGLYLIKRVIALGGQMIDIDHDKVSVDDDAVEEPYLFIDKKYPDPMPRLHEKIPPGKLFVLGDDRHISFDSRFPKFGLVDRADVRGRVIYVMPTVRKSLNWTELRPK